eukprot:TRINITY_DN1203_c0_g2_i1.p1 TRINITY_DN1203_c0_g2~~TRINITY_DN1203_c0_g2_i1.p1  ORF type:complete len:266 (-),score=78.32 TRINITY_DN1203_c0_g2_i1:138-935(-)
MKLEGLVAIVTGGASGLGEAAVRALLDANVRVVIADINDRQGELISKSAGDDKCVYIKTDITNEDNVRELIEKTVSLFGALHIVVNCAGVITAGLIVNAKGNILSTDEMLKVLRINVMGTFNVCKYAARQMTKQNAVTNTTTNTGDPLIERGVIINVASVAGIEGQKGQTIYSASKGAIIGMTLPMARDLGTHGIRVVTVAPGIFFTPMAKEISPKIADFLKKSTALGRLGDPREFAQAVISAVENSYLTGTVLRLDGGVRLPHL